MNEPRTTLQGMFFHGVDDAGEIKTQGYVKFVIGNYAMIQFFSWIDGGHTNCRLVELDDLCDIRFYGDREEMEIAYIKSQKRANPETDPTD